MDLVQPTTDELQVYHLLLNRGAITIFYKQNRAKKSSREIDVGTNPTIVQL